MIRFLRWLSRHSRYWRFGNCAVVIGSFPSMDVVGVSVRFLRLGEPEGPGSYAPSHGFSIFYPWEDIEDHIGLLHWRQLRYDDSYDGSEINAARWTGRTHRLLRINWPRVRTW